MNFKIAPVEDGDMDRLFAITSLAFQQNEEIWNAVYPQHETPEGRKAGADRFVQVKAADPNTHYIKAITPDGEIAGFAKWNIYRQAFPPSDIKVEGPYWTTEDGRQYAEHLANEFFKERVSFVGSKAGHAVNLDQCCVDPKYQRMGIGSALVGWGVEKADELNVDAIVEASVFGKGLYEKHGFVYQRTVEIPLPDKWMGRPKCRFAWMVRPARTSANSS